MTTQNEDVTVTTKTITVVQVGQDKTFVEVPEGATWAEVWNKVGGEGKKVTSGNEDISRKLEEQIPPDATHVTVGPQQGKAGL